jgi:hypothetical protein
VETESDCLIGGGWNYNGIASPPQNLLKTLVMPAYDQENDRVLRLADRCLCSHSFDQFQRRHRHQGGEVGEESMTYSVTLLEAYKESE